MVTLPKIPVGRALTSALGGSNALTTARRAVTAGGTVARALGVRAPQIKRPQLSNVKRALQAATKKQIQLLSHSTPRSAAIGLAPVAAIAKKTLSPNAREWVRAVGKKKLATGKARRTRRETSGLSADAKIYTVEPNEGLIVITRKLLNGGKPFALENTRYRDLLKSNPQYPKTADGSNFKNVYTGMKLNVPLAWAIKPAPAQIPVSSTTAPATSTTQAPIVVSVPATAQSTGSSSAPAQTAPTQTTQAQTGPSFGGTELNQSQVADAKAVLIAWSATDGKSLGEIADYGEQDQDHTSTWNVGRDGAQLLAFEKWSNTFSPAKLELTSILHASQYAALVTWANAHLIAADQVATQIKTQRAKVPTGLPGQTATAQNPAAPAQTTGSGGTVATGSTPATGSGATTTSAPVLGGDVKDKPAETKSSGAGGALLATALAALMFM